MTTEKISGGSRIASESSQAAERKRSDSESSRSAER